MMKILKILSFSLLVGCWAIDPVLAQESAAILTDVLAAHGVTAAVSQAQVLLRGQYSATGQSTNQVIPLLIKTRGRDEFRFEIHASSGLRVTGQSKGFRWSRHGSEKVVGYDGRLSLNVPFMESPSTGLLAYLLAHVDRIQWLGMNQGTLNGKAVLYIRLQVADNDPTRRNLRSPFDRGYELLVDATSKFLVGASVIPRPTAPASRDNYHFENYLVKNGLAFPSRIRRSNGPLDQPANEFVSTLTIESITLNQSFPDIDFARPNS